MLSRRKIVSLPLLAMLWATPTSADLPLWVAILGNDGSIRPLVKLDGSDWAPVWPEPFIPGSVARVEAGGTLQATTGGADWATQPWSLPVVRGSAVAAHLDVPLSWHAYQQPSSKPDSIRPTFLVLAPAGCTMVWRLKTDWRGRKKLRPRETPAAIGVALSQMKPVADLAHQARIDAELSELGLVDPPAGSRGPKHSSLGWFVHEDVLIGVIQLRYSEATQYRIVEIGADSTRIVIAAFGGSC